MWTIGDRLWLTAGENQPSALTDLIARALATAVNSPTFVADQSFASDGTTSYINTGYNPSTNGVHWTLNSASHAFWSFGALGNVDCGVQGAIESGPTNLSRLRTGTNYFYSANATSDGSVAGASASGLWTASRTASNLTTLYNNDVSQDTNAVASSGVTNLTMYALVENLNGVANFSTNTPVPKCSAIWYGGGLSQANMTLLYNRLRTYMTAIGVP